MKKICYLSIVAILATALVFATSQTTKQNTEQNNLPAAKELFAKFAENLGGKQSAEKIKTRLMKGTVEVSGANLKGTFESVAKSPDKTLMAMNLTGYGEVINGFDGTTGWVKDPVQGNRTKSGAELERVKQSADFYYNFNLDKIFPAAQTIAAEKIGEADVYAVKASDDTKLYFDRKSGLLVRSERQVPAPRGDSKMTVQFTYDDYKEVDGLKIPFTMRQSAHGGDILFKTTEIKQNLEITDTRFTKPS